MQFITINLEAPQEGILDIHTRCVNWSDENVSNSKKFYQQVINNRNLLEVLEYQIESRATYLDSNASERFLSSDDYDNSIDTDMDVISFYEAIKDPCAIVLIYNNIYYGHAYVWITETKRCLVHNVSCRVDELFLEELPCLRKEMLEEYLRFAREKECNHLTIADSETKVGEIAMKIGGKKDRLHMQEIKGSTLYPEGSRVFDIIYKDLEIDAVTIAL
jgi:hypothetical protein